MTPRNYAFLVSCMLMFHGCSRDNGTATFRVVRITDYDAETNTILGIDMPHPKDLSAYSTGYPGQSFIVGAFKGRTLRLASPDQRSWSALYSRSRGTILVVTARGVLEYAPDTGEATCTWILDKELILTRYTVNADGSRLALMGVGDGPNPRFMVLFDVPSGEATEISVDELPSGMAFSDEGDLLASIGSDLLRVCAPGTGKPSTALSRGVVGDRSIAGVYQGKPVYLGAAKRTIHIAGQVVGLADAIVTLHVARSGLWILSEKGQVVMLAWDGSRTVEGAFDRKRIIGYGGTSDGLWIALEDGTFHTIGHSRRTIRLDFIKASGD